MKISSEASTTATSSSTSDEIERLERQKLELLQQVFKSSRYDDKVKRETHEQIEVIARRISHLKTRNIPKGT